MHVKRTLVSLLLSLTLAFAPGVSAARAGGCISMMAGLSQSVDCPCGAMGPGCKAMGRCLDAATCAQQCAAPYAIVLAADHGQAQAHNGLPIDPDTRLSSRTTRPPSPPPRT